MGNEVENIEGFHKIDGVLVTPLKFISDDRGAVLHFLRSDSPSYKNFGEAYFSLINEFVVKGWKRHKILYQNLCVPHGVVKFVIYDNREESLTKGNIQEVVLDSKENYNLLSLPAGLWYSFKCLCNNYALIANIIDVPHSPEESETLPLINNEIPYEWRL